MSKIITSYLLWGWFIRSSLQHRVSWVGIRWIIDFFFFVFKVLHLHWGAPSCLSTVHVMTSVHQWAHSMFMFLTGSPPCLTQDDSDHQFFLFFFKHLHHSDTSCSSVQIWFQMCAPHTGAMILSTNPRKTANPLICKEIISFLRVTDTLNASSIFSWEITFKMPVVLVLTYF